MLLGPSCTLEVYDQSQRGARCGDGVVEPGEVCDDGNQISGDGCSANCQSTEICGNGIVDVAAGEVCDDGNTKGGDGCSADCRSFETCGNGIVDVARGEVCDDGNTNDGDGCSADCRSTGLCGNGVVDPGEQCDSSGPSITCNANCTVSRCGDGILNVLAGEICDDGNTINGDGCEASCTPTP